MCDIKDDIIDVVMENRGGQLSISGVDIVEEVAKYIITLSEGDIVSDDVKTFVDLHFVWVNDFEEREEEGGEVDKKARFLRLNDVHE